MNGSSDNAKSKVRVNLANVPGPDFTAYDEKRAEQVLPFNFKEILEGTDVQPDARETKRYSYSFPALTQGAAGDLFGRALVCSAYADTFWSITLRCDEENTRPKILGYEVPLKSAITSYVQKLYETLPQPRGKVKLRDVLGYCPQGYSAYSTAVIDEPLPSTPGEQSQKEIFLNDIHPLCNVLYKLLFPADGLSIQASGLLAITGATDSSKSLITRGLIFLYLEAAARKARNSGQRKPHLITFEDPIEQYFIKNPLSKTVPQSLTELKSLLDALYVDYTPREKDLDARDLKQVTRDALRQTPAVLYVGETREKADWKDLLDFAGSGHLVVTTAHASSIIEAMTGIFRDTETKTPAQRSEIARRILGIINIRSFSSPSMPSTSNESRGDPMPPTEGRPQGVRALVPALWKNTSQSRNNLIADGLASLLPALGLNPEIGYYSRTHFVNELTSESLLTDEIKKNPDKCLSLVSDLRRKAREWDIEGV